MKQILTHGPITTLLAVMLFFTGSAILAFTNVAYGQAESDWRVLVHTNGEMELLDPDQDGSLEYAQLDAENETQAILELAREYGVDWDEAAEKTYFEYQALSNQDFDSTEDEFSLDAMVNEEGFTVINMRVNGEVETYWFKTRNVRTAIDWLGDVYGGVRTPVLYDALIESDYSAVTVVQMNNEEDNQESVTFESEEEMSTNGGAIFYVYQGRGQSAIMAYRNGGLDESYYYESDNRSEIVSQLALRYGMSEAEVEERSVFETDGIDHVDLENRMGRDDIYDPHEGDPRADGNQTPVPGF